MTPWWWSSSYISTPLQPPPSLKPPLDWSVRQRRSRPVFLTNNKYPKKQAQRASPTTPLSWSGATSPSGGSGGSGAAGGGGSEESSRPHTKNLSNITRSKIEFRPLPDREVSVPPIVPPIISDNNVQLQSSTSNDSPKQNADALSDSKFVLPDLNMPFEEEARPDVICGVS